MEKEDLEMNGASVEYPGTTVQTAEANYIH